MTENDLARLRRAARSLKGSRGYWGSFAAEEHLMGWILSCGQCVYCGVNLLERPHTIDGSASTDHLLPKTAYPKLDREPLNAVPACAGCNNIKRDWDPNTKGGPTLYNADEGPPFTNEMREEFISRAKRHIHAERRRRAESFEEDHKRWLETVDQWRHD